MQNERISIHTHLTYILFIFPMIKSMNENKMLKAYLQSVRLVIPANVVIGTLGTSPFILTEL